MERIHSNSEGDPKFIINKLPEIHPKDEYHLTRSQAFRITKVTTGPEIIEAPKYKPTIPMISVSEARHERIKRAKPKIYISARANSIQPIGRPYTYKEHLARVYNKEDTPVVPYEIVNQFGSKKDGRKQLMDTYLANFNIEALKSQHPEIYKYLNG